jgi:hypothetical protein
MPSLDVTLQLLDVKHLYSNIRRVTQISSDRLRSVLEGTHAISGKRDFTGAERHLGHRNAGSVRSMRIRKETQYGFWIVPKTDIGVTTLQRKSHSCCSARDWERSGLLEGIPRAVVQISALL